MNDTLRMLLMNLMTAAIALAVAFGLNLTEEQSVGLTGFGAITINLVAYFWKTGQEPGPVV